MHWVAPASLLPALLLVAPTPPLFADETEEDDEAFFEQWLRGEDLDTLSDLDFPEPRPIIPKEAFPPSSLWDLETKVSVGAGYRDNATRSTLDPQGGAFLLGTFETMLLRIDDEVRFFLFLDAEHREFAFDRDLPSETVATALSQLSLPLGEDLTGNLLLRSFFLDGMVDAATLDDPLRPAMEARGHGATLSPGLRKEWPSNVFAAAGFSGTRQKMREPLWDFWEFGPKVTTGWSPPGGELALSVEYLWRDYDDRPARSLDGAPMEGTKLDLGILRPEISFRFAWGESRWQSHSRAGFDFYRDNATGYHDYDRFRVSQRLAYRAERWEVEAQLGYSHYDYKNLKTASGASERQSWWESSLKARRLLTDHLELFARYELERMDGVALDFTVNTWTAGLGWTF